MARLEPLRIEVVYRPKAPGLPCNVPVYRIVSVRLKRYVAQTWSLRVARQWKRRMERLDWSKIKDGRSRKALTILFWQILGIVSTERFREIGEDMRRMKSSTKIKP